MIIATFSPNFNGIKVTKVTESNINGLDLYNLSLF